MNAVVGYHDEEMDYAVDFGRDRDTIQKRSRHPDYRRKGSAPARVNGMHCRRNKRWTFGSGHGARVLTLRAFAGCLALCVASIAASASAVTIDYRTISNPGNPGNTVSGTAGPSSPSGLGAVSAVFRMAATETTNAQYAAFLNAVDPNGTNPRGVYVLSMGTSSLGGITFNAGAGSGAKYSVKSGAPSGAPAGTSYGQMPVNFVTWFSAARFVNWLNNGTPSGTAATASMEIGAYTLNSATSGNIVARNANAQVFLPSVNEWYKAAYYTGSNSTYTLYPTNSNAAPTASVSNVTLTNAANYNSVMSSARNVGSFVNTTSAYGLFDMLGNVTEMTDNTGRATSTSMRLMGGPWTASTSNWTAKTAASNFLGSSSAQNLGFRVAAVPEPGTIALAGLGIASLFGLDWMKRRKKRQADARDLA
jgi:formylglycine-generating enzyme required for sulfatase activity